MRVQLAFDGDLVVEVYGGAEYIVFAVSLGIKLVVDGHAISDGDPLEEM